MFTRKRTPKSADADFGAKDDGDASVTLTVEATVPAAIRLGISMVAGAGDPVHGKP
jgi:hypothetical protein